MFKMLIIDRDGAIRSMLSSYFGRQGFSCTLVATVMEALVEFESEPFDVILMDLSEQRIAELHFLRYALAVRPDMRAIAMCTLCDPHLVREALEAGATMCVPKPFKLSELFMHVKTVLRRRLTP